MHPSSTTLGQIKKIGYQSKTIKTEIQKNLITAIQNKTNVFEGILGYEDTVIPDIERAILSGHNINLLGLRGQAKTSIARKMIYLLDEYVPFVSGSEINDDPFSPLSKYAKDLIAEMGDETPISWLHRENRYTEKLATPDVTVADLIGDIDPIKAANLKLHYSDERVIHFGLIPRSNRCIFVINELPDLQARIQVALFNILQEGDIQIRGFKIRLPLDIQFVFTANPEDYTNRGSIVTPLKDRIESQIITHYPKSIEVGKQITLEQARIKAKEKSQIAIPELSQNLIEQIAIEARKSEYVDAKSGVSVRLTISALENLVSTAQRRMLLNAESSTTIRVTDFWGVTPAITGKIELVYEGEQEGSGIVAQNLISKAIREQFLLIFPNPEKNKKAKLTEPNPYVEVTTWFSSDHHVDLLNDMSDVAYEKMLKGVAGLEKIVDHYVPQAKKNEKLFWMEFVLHGLATCSQLSKNYLVRGVEFKDLFSSMFSGGSFEEEE
jgi:magnesium chelatase subunit I